MQKLLEGRHEGSIVQFASRLIAIGLAAYAVTFLVLFINQRSYIYLPPAGVDFWECPYFPEETKREHLGTRFYYQDSGKRLLVLYHGNADAACYRSLLADYATAHDISYLFVEYAGYAGDGEEPSQKNIYEDVEHVIDFLERESYEKVALLGESIGAGVAMHHATLSEPDKLIFISPFTRLSDVAAIHYPWYPVRLALREEYDIVSTLPEFQGELLLIHGTIDEIIPHEMSKQLYEAAASAIDKRLVLMENARHNDLFSNSTVLEHIREFIQR